MPVTKRIKNLINSLFRGWVGFEGLDFDYRPGLIVKDKKRIIALLTNFGTTMRAKLNSRIGDI